MRPIGNLFRDELRIGNDDIGPLKRMHDAGAYAYVLDSASKVTDLDGVAFINWAFEEHDQARDKIIYNALQPETDTDAERTCQHRDFAKIHPQ